MVGLPCKSLDFVGNVRGPNCALEVSMVRSIGRGAWVCNRKTRIMPLYMHNSL